MTSSVIVRLNIEGGPDIELTPAQFRDLYEQMGKIAGRPLDNKPMFQTWFPSDVELQSKGKFSSSMLGPF